MQIDTSTPFGERVARRLQDEVVIWLVTTRPDGTPEPSPVWFLWDGETFLIYSLRDTPREKNIRRNSNVSLHFDSTRGADVVVFTAQAEIVEDAPQARDNIAYLEKYRDHISRIGSTP